MKALAYLVAGLTLALPMTAQSPAQLKQELRTKETAAKTDTEALAAVAKWAEEQGLAAEAKRIYQAILKIKPDHEAANRALGNELVEGKWLPKKDAEAARKKAMEAEFKAKGLVDVGGVWVEKDHVVDAKKGVFHHEGQKVTKEEKVALSSGMVRHPETGQVIEAQFLEKAQNKQFPIGTEGRWVDEKEADRYHSDAKRPWMIRTAYCTIISTLPLSILGTVKNEVDRGYETVRPLLANMEPSPSFRPVILVSATKEEHQEYGNAMGDETSSYGAFYATAEAQVKVAMQGEVRPAVAIWLPDWGPYYARHAAGLAYAGSLAVEMGVELPKWFQHGIGSLASRFSIKRDAGHFGGQHVAKGGVKNLKSFFTSFTINGEMESKDIDYMIYQAGLVLHFAKEGGDAKALDALVDITNAVAAGKSKGVDKSIEKFAALVAGKEDEVKAHLQKLVAEMNR
ncbi:MAG: hypothetical protein IPK26_18920 [Planctomycetes bacterium]|nr:hypothetical protein [Planctomycetota bacterium]